MRDRVHATLITMLALVASSFAPPAALASTPPPAKVVIIVGPVGSMTDGYRNQGNQIASAATAAGATVVKVFSPNATWAKVRAAVAGANIIVYLGHGNGFPNPYSSLYLPDRVDGWGLNTALDSGDANLVYCGEKALLGTLTSSDGSNQWTYCGGSTNTDGIAPAAGFLMIYSGACYAPGANEPQNPDATAYEALHHVAYFSRPVLSGLGASGYFATDHGGATLVSAVLANPDVSYGNIYLANQPDGIAADYPHLLVSGKRSWLARTPDFTYAFAGDPGHTFGGGTAPYDAPPPPAPMVINLAPTPGATGVRMSPTVKVTFSEPVSNVTSATIVLWDAVTWKVLAGSSVTLNDTAAVASLVPAKPLQPKHKYALRVSTRIVDLHGNSIAYASMLFTTASSETYSPQRSLAFAAGTYTGYRFSSSGTILGSRSYTLARASGAPTSKRSAIAGKTGGWYYVTAGVWSGYWMKEGTGITLQ